MTKRLLLMILVLLLPSWMVAQRSDLSGLKFCIDPGHGGHNAANDRNVVPDPGVDFWESESNFQKALLLKTLLEAKNATVILTRYTNDYPNDANEPSLSARVAVANANNVNWFHSIHSNAFNGSVNYTLILVREKRGANSYATGPGQGVPETQGAWDMAAIVGPAIASNLRTSSSTRSLDWTFYGGASGGFSLGVLTGLQMPGELSEGSFHDYLPETRRLMNDNYRNMEAHALLKSFLQYFGAPGDSMGIVAGIQIDGGTGKPKNGTVVRILPENWTYLGDNYNNGFYMFDSLTPGPHTLVFDTPRYDNDTVSINLTAGAVQFVDRTIHYSSYPFVTATTPAPDDSSALADHAVTITFSTPMDTASVNNAISFSPLVSGTISWTEDLRAVSFTPASRFEYLTSYTVTIDSSARALNGYSLDTDGNEVGGDSVVFSFRTEPALIAAGISFGQVKNGDTSSVLIRIRNRASYDIALQDVQTSAPEFLISSSLPDTVRGNDSLDIGVSFNPVSFGSYLDTLVVLSNGGVLRVPLSGSSPAPSLTLSHSFLGFGSVRLDTTSSRAIYLFTTSINGVRIDSLFTKSAAFQFAPPLSFPVTLTPGDTLHLTVTFAPQALGGIVDTLMVLTNAPSPVSKITLTGNGSAVSSSEEIESPILDFSLSQNYPNPFNPDTRIEYSIAHSAPVRLEIMDILGQSVCVLYAGQREPGHYGITWNGADDTGRKISSGVYFCRLSAGGYVFSKKMVLLK